MRRGESSPTAPLKRRDLPERSSVAEHRSPTNQRRRSSYFSPIDALTAIKPPAAIEMSSGSVPSSAIHAMTETVPTTIASAAIGTRRNRLITRLSMLGPPAAANKPSRVPVATPHDLTRDHFFLVGFGSSVPTHSYALSNHTAISAVSARRSAGTET